MKSLIFTEPAARDISSIIDYIKLDNPVAAEQVFREIIRASESLRHFPNLGKRGRVSGTREIILTDVSYVIAYRSVENRIIILAIFHTARDLRVILRERVYALKLGNT